METLATRLQRLEKPYYMGKHLYQVETEMTRLNPTKLAKDRLENLIIEDFLKWLHRRKGYQAALQERPEPPDALFTVNNRKMWLEIVDAFRSPDEAREFNSAITPGKQLYHHRESVIIDPDKSITKAVFNQIWLKNCKSNYLETYNNLGPGVLITHCPDPLYEDETFEIISDYFTDYQQFCEAEMSRPNTLYTGYFKWVFITEGQGSFRFLGQLPHHNRLNSG